MATGLGYKKDVSYGSPMNIDLNEIRHFYHTTKRAEFMMRDLQHFLRLFLLSLTSAFRPRHLPMPTHPFTPLRDIPPFKLTPPHRPNAVLELKVGGLY